MYFYYYFIYYYYYCFYLFIYLFYYYFIFFAVKTTKNNNNNNFQNWTWEIQCENNNLVDSFHISGTNILQKRMEFMNVKIHNHNISINKCPECFYYLLEILIHFG